MKKMILVVAICLSFCLTACGVNSDGDFGLDRTITLDNGLSFKVSSGWQETTTENNDPEYGRMTLMNIRAGSSISGADVGFIGVGCYYEYPIDPYKEIETNIEVMQNTDGVTHFESSTPSESVVDGMRLVRFDSSTAYHDQSPVPLRLVYISKDDQTVTFSYTPGEFTSKEDQAVFDAVIESVDWP